MEYFFYPKSIVIFGASNDSRKSGNRVLRNILNYTKENIYLIHPREEEIYGIRCYKSIFDLTLKQIDLAIIILPVEFVLDALEDCIEFQVRAVIIESADIYLKDEKKDFNKERLKNIKEKLKRYNKTRIMGPNSIGIYCANQDNNDLITSLIYFEKLPSLKKKNLSLISQTGLTLSALLYSQNFIQEIGFSKIAAIGNKWDINESDLLNYIANDPKTDVIGLYLEDIKNGKRFREQCSIIATKKPIILLKSGKTEQGKKAIMSHTKSLAGNYKIIETLCKQMGIITVEDFNELFIISKCLLNQPFPRGNKVGVISVSGAGTVIACDLSAKYNLELPLLTIKQKNKLKEIFPKYAWDEIFNPLDVWSAVEQVGANNVYEVAGEAFLEGNNIDILIYLIGALKGIEFDFSILKNFNDRFPENPIYIGFFGGDKELILEWKKVLEEKYNIPTFNSIKIIMKAISKILQLKLK